MKQISDNEIYLLIKYIKSFLWRIAKRLSYIEDAWCLKVKNSDQKCCTALLWRSRLLHQIHLMFIFQRTDPRPNALSNAGSNHNAILESRDGSCTEESQRNLIRLALVEEIRPKHIIKYHCWEHKNRRTTCIEGRYSSFKKRPVFFCGQNQNNYTGAFSCVLCGAHIFKCQSTNSWRNIFHAWRQAPCVLQLSQQRDLFVSAQRVTR